jgi:uncharacterized cupredoxin-like copper-binding protein
VTAKEFAFDLPASVKAGTTAINLKNTGAEEHQAQLVKLQTGKAMTDLLAALQKPDPSEALKLVTLAGGPAGVAPGTTGSTTVNLDAGNYAFICFVQGADGIPHFAKGMIAPLEVTGTTASTDLPKGDADLHVKDFSFDLSTLTAGKHRLNVDNQGPQPHEAQIVKLAEGMTVDKVRQMITSSPPPSGAPQQGPPPFTSVGGMSGIAPGSKATLDVDLPAGNYAFICFIPDPASGKSHFELGMFTPLTVQ